MQGNRAITKFSLFNMIAGSNRTEIEKKKSLNHFATFGRELKKLEDFFLNCQITLSHTISRLF